MKCPRSYAVFADEHEEDLLYLETDKAGHTIFAARSGIYRFHREVDAIDGSKFKRLASYTAITPLKYFSQELLEICFCSDSHARRLCGVI